MKRLLVLIAVLAISTIACQAFNDSYGDEPVTTGGEGEEGQTPVNVGGEVQTGDQIDTTECVPVEGVTVVKAAESGKVKETALSAAEEGAKLSTMAEQIGTVTTKVTVLNGDEEAISFTLKLTGDDKFDLCSVSYKGMKVKSGEVTVDTFNEEKVNAGEFKFEFTAAAEEGAESTALKAMANLFKAADEAVAEEVTAVSGTYFTDATVDKVTKVDEEKKE